MPYFLVYSSPLFILLGISTSVAMFGIALWKGSTQSIKLPTNSAIYSSCFLVSPGVDSLWFGSVFKFILLFNSFLSLAGIWEFRMKFSAILHGVELTIRRSSDG